MIIHGGAPSPFTRKVAVACEEKGISYVGRAHSTNPSGGWLGPV
jgi:glutathione S-transferase